MALSVRPRFFHRGIIPLLTLFFSASGSQKTAVTPLEDSGRCHSACRPLRGDQFPDDPRWLSGQAGAFCSLTALSRRNHAPRQTHPASWERQRTAPRRGASLKCGRNLRFPHKRPLPDCGAVWKFRRPFCWAGLAVAGSWLLWEGQPLRSNVAGTCGSPTILPEQLSVQVPCPAAAPI